MVGERARNPLAECVTNVDGSSLEAQMRSRRLTVLLRIFSTLGSYRVRNHGGTRNWWSGSPIMPSHL